MKPFITSAKRAKCKGCGSTDFTKKSVSAYFNPMPFCSACGGDITKYRVVFKVPIVGGSGFKKIDRETDNRGRPLDRPSVADQFCDFLKEKLSISEGEFDPREIGTKEERDFFLVKNCSKAYLEFHLNKESKGKLTPGGYAKKHRISRLNIVPLFGEFSVKELTYQLINRVIVKSKLSDSQVSEVVKELGPFFKWCCMEGLIKHSPELPEKPKDKKYKSNDFYTLEERNMIIGNIKKRKLQIAITILSKYTRRKSEIECLRWGDVDFKTKEITFSRHMSDGKGVVESKELPGLKSSPEASLTYDFFPGLHQMLLELGPSLDKNKLVFEGKPGKMMGKNVFYEAWKKSALELIEKRKLKKFVDLHRGTRSSTLSALYQNGQALEMLAELYGGDIKTLKDHYAKKTKQNLGELLELNY